MRTGKRRPSRWLFGYPGRVPRSVRLSFFVASLSIVAGVYRATGSEGLQILALYAMVFLVFPLLGRRFARVDEHSDALVEHRPPIRTLAWSFVLGIAWGSLVLALAPYLALGPWFWWLMAVWPWLEIDTYLAERSLRRVGVGAWPLVRPLRDPRLAGVVRCR